MRSARVSSFGAKRYHWVDARRPASWNPAGEHRGQKEQQSDSQKSEWVRRAHAIEQRAEPLSEQERSADADGDARHRQPAALAKNHPQDVFARGAERHPDTDLMRALRNRVGDHAVNSRER